MTTRLFPFALAILGASAVSFTAGTAVAADPVCTPRPAGMVAWWTGDRTADDLLGQYHGVNYSVGYWGGYIGGYAFRPDGQLDWIEIADVPTGGTALTIEGWALRETHGSYNQRYTILSKYTQDQGGWHLAWGVGNETDPKIYFTSYSASQTGGPHTRAVTTTTTTTNYQLLHVAVTFEAVPAGETFARIYVNGVEQDTDIVDDEYFETIGSDAGTVRIGTGSNAGGKTSQYFYGRLDEISLYDRALSESQIIAIYEAGSAGKCRTISDIDNDGIPDDVDNCSGAYNPDQVDQDYDGFGDACDVCPLDADNDVDNDGVCGNVDNCIDTHNPNQLDNDYDGMGDACDTCPLDADNDLDGDEVCGSVDNCPTMTNADQANADDDEFGDVCDTCPLDIGNDADLDGVCESADNCPIDANAAQLDSDVDGLGNACDACPLDAFNDADGDGLCGDIDAEVGFKKAKVSFHEGKVKVDGELSLPSGYWTDNLDPTGYLSLMVAGTELADQAFDFEITGRSHKKWGYEDKDLSLGTVKKAKVDWKGSKFDFKGEHGFKIKTTFIGGNETTLQIETGSLAEVFTVTIGDTEISYDASRDITTNVEYEAHKPDNKKVYFTLPYQLQTDMMVLVSGAHQHAILVADYFDQGTVKFKTEVRFDATLFSSEGDTTPQELAYFISLGDTVYGYGEIKDADWDEIKDHEWKF